MTSSTTTATTMMTLYSSNWDDFSNLDFLSSATDNTNSEKRKEKSRKAARERRSQESKIFDQIEEILPVSTKTLEHLDKASLVRIAINFLKIRSVIDPLKVSEQNDNDQIDFTPLNTLNGFVFVLSKDGDITYLSENVERILGLSQIDLMGQSIYDYSHPCDHDDLKLFLEPLTAAFNASKYASKVVERSAPPAAGGKEATADACLGDLVGPFFIRMKNTLTNKGRNLNLKAANFKVVKCTGRMLDLETANPEYAQTIGENFRQYMIGIGEIIQHPARIEAPLGGDVFMSKHSPDLKFTYADECIESLFGYKTSDLIGTSFYRYFDGNDFKPISDFFKTLFAKGQCDSGFFKFLVKTGGYRWISTQATVITESNSNQPQSIILINRIISGVENGHLITSDVQQQSQPQQQEISSSAPESVIDPPIIINQPVSATASVIKSKPLAIYEYNVNGNSVSGNRNVNSVLPPLDIDPQQPPLAALASLSPLLKNEDDEQLSVQQLASPQLIPAASENCISSTATVLAPKTADMESGFLMFTDDNKGITVLTDADDLTHLAPDAGDLCVPMLSDMDFTDLSLFDDIFLNTASFNFNAADNIDDDDDNENDLLNTFDGYDQCSSAQKLSKMDAFDQLGFESGCGALKSGGYMLMKGRGAGGGGAGGVVVGNGGLSNGTGDHLKSAGNLIDQPQQYLANDPFLSFGTATTNDADLLIASSPVTPSSSLSDHYSSSSNSPTGSPMMSCMTHFSSPNSLTSSSSSSSSSISDDKALCDTTDFGDDKDLEMRAPFIPIEDNFLLNEFAYSDSNMDDFFNWISNGNATIGNIGNNNNNNNNNNSTNKSSLATTDCGTHSSATINANRSKRSSTPSSKNGGGSACLEALLQNDELICNLKNKIAYNSNQLLNRSRTPQQQQSSIASMHSQQPTFSVINSQQPQQQQQQQTSQQQQQQQQLPTMKRKNSNILIYTTYNSGEKKFKNLVLSAENINPAKLSDKSTVHHFVLTKNNELIPKSDFVNQQSQLKVSSKRVLPFTATVSSPNAVDSDQLSCLTNVAPNGGANGPTLSQHDHHSVTKEDLFFKKPRQEPDKNSYSNSVLLNLLVSGADLPNGYEINHPHHHPHHSYQGKMV